MRLIILDIISKLVERLKFKKTGHPHKRVVLGSSLNEDNLLHYNKVFSRQKKKL